MVRTCENTYSSSWFDIIKNSFGKSKYNTDQKALCVQKAGHFRRGVEVGGKENYSGNESWCEDPCIVQYLLGMQFIIFLYYFILQTKFMFNIPSNFECFNGSITYYRKQFYSIKQRRRN